MKTTMNCRHYNHTPFNRVDNYKITRQNIYVSVAIMAINFGMQAYSFLRNLVTIGGNPYEGLNRGQRRQMYFLPYMIGY